MTTTLRQNSGQLQFTVAGSPVVGGTGFLLVDTFGVIGADAAVGDLGVLDATPGHVHEIACNSADVILQGDSLYWDDGASELTLTGAGNFYAGKAFTAAAGGVVLCEVMIVNGNGVLGV